MAHDGSVAAPDIQPTGQRNARMRQTIGDMVRSMLVVLAFVAVLLLVTWRPQPEAVKVIDPSTAITLATTEADFPLQVPQGLTDGWRPTSARWEATEKSSPEPVLHIGYVTPADAYAQVTQSSSISEPYVAEQTFNGRAVGEAVIAGITWQRWEYGDRRSLLRLEPGVTTIVSGTASWDELTALATSLQSGTAA